MVQRDTDLGGPKTAVKAQPERRIKIGKQVRYAPEAAGNATGETIKQLQASSRGRLDLVIKGRTRDAELQFAKIAGMADGPAKGRFVFAAQRKGVNSAAGLFLHQINASIAMILPLVSSKTEALPDSRNSSAMLVTRGTVVAQRALGPGA